jgi:hypothetical protein
VHRMTSFRHPISVPNHSVIFGHSRGFSRRNYLALALLATLVFSAAPRLAAQDPAPVPAAQSESSSQQKPSSSTGHHGDDFLVRGTVFTPQGLALPGAELRIRRASEKKFRWQTVSNSRGDFALRVKMGADYRVTVHVKGFPDQSQSVDAKTGERFKDLVFRMPQQESRKQ